jgi:DNA modification methylase
MRTRHDVRVGDARSMTALDDDGVDLIVTSPPYPMIELWDETFGGLDDRIEAALSAGEGWEAFDLMHEVLDGVWDELVRVLAPGGIACVNVGDATRSVDGRFRQYPNHARIVEAMTGRGLEPLPDVLWRKPTNSAAKFMGSGMLPTNAYVTLEHEYVLVFRNGGTRAFDDEPRRESAYFWEERNEWFSDVWDDVGGRFQADAAVDADRSRTGAYPFEIPYRLVCMYSVYGDTVLDPFWGTGTTTLAAMVAGRDSAGYELDSGFVRAFDGDAAAVPSLSNRVVSERLADHRSFVDRRCEAGSPPKYDAVHYDFPVTTKQERTLQLYAASSVDRIDEEDEAEPSRRYEVAYDPQ